MNCGSFRSNAILPKGDFTLKMVYDLIPAAAKIVTTRMPGDIVLQLLENSVSQWPALDGRFATFSGLKYSFDPEMPAGSRVHSVKTLTGEPFDLSREASYTLVAKHFIALGRDGYHAFQDPAVEFLSDLDTSPNLQDIVVGAFERTSPDYKIVEKREAIR